MEKEIAVGELAGAAVEELVRDLEGEARSDRKLWTEDFAASGKLGKQPPP